VDGRGKAEYVTPENDEDTPFEKYWNTDEWERREATLHKREGTYYLHVTVAKEQPVDESTTQHGAVLGVHKSEALVQPIRNLRFLRTSISTWMDTSRLLRRVRSSAMPICSTTNETSTNDGVVVSSRPGLGRLISLSSQ
jgi:hypothetical protein